MSCVLIKEVCLYNDKALNLDYSPVKQSDFHSSTGLMLSMLQLENLSLFGWEPSVAWENIMKFPLFPPGEHEPEGSC